MLSGKTILITGASSGIGRAAACMISHSGASVVITGRDEKRLASTELEVRKGFAMDGSPAGSPRRTEGNGNDTADGGGLMSGTGSPSNTSGNSRYNTDGGGSMPKFGSPLNTPENGQDNSDAEGPVSKTGTSVKVSGNNRDISDMGGQMSTDFPGCLTIRADLTEVADLEALVNQLPRLDGIVHCAGIVGPLPVKFITPEDIDRMFVINYRAPVNLTSLILRKKKLTDHASVVFMSTIATRNPYFGGALYSGSKAALEAYSRTLALEMAGKGIRSNFIMAGLVDTPMIENPSEEKMQEEALERYLKRYPLGVGKPEDVAAAICYFLSDASRWVSGTSLIMGGE
jgi:NAD(P)-dependent dehydrogenase (short-subunit alcohol dehydrogenase family)